MAPPSLFSHRDDCYIVGIFTASITWLIVVLIHGMLWAGWFVFLVVCIFTLYTCTKLINEGICCM